MPSPDICVAMAVSKASSQASGEAIDDAVAGVEVMCGHTLGDTKHTGWCDEEELRVVSAAFPTWRRAEVAIIVCCASQNLSGFGDNCTHDTPLPETSRARLESALGVASGTIRPCWNIGMLLHRQL